MDLLPSRLPRIDDLEDVGKVRVAHGGQATYAVSADGRRWVRKREVNVGVQELLAEALGWLLGSRLGAPVPQGAYSLKPEACWLSEMVPQVEHWGRLAAARVHNLDQLGAVIALDAVLLNEDRHSGNLLIQPDPDEWHLRAWSIDMGNAFAGYAADFKVRKDDVPDPRNHALGLPIELLRDHAIAAAHAAASIEERELRADVMEACALAGESAVDSLADTLVHRCRNASDLVARYTELLERLR